MKERVQTRLDPDTHTQLEEYCTDREITEAEALRRFVRASLGGAPPAAGGGPSASTDTTPARTPTSRSSSSDDGSTTLSREETLELLEKRYGSD